MLSRISIVRLAWFCALLFFLISSLVLLGFPPANAVTITEFPVPTVNSEPWGITAGPDGNLWFTEEKGNKIGRITTAGVVTEFPVLTVYDLSMGITAGEDGNLWFTEGASDRIGRITTSGVVTLFPVPTEDSGPNYITAGPDGNLWFTEIYANKFGRITTAGAVTEFPVPTGGSGPVGITAGPDGNLWFTEPAGDKIGRVFIWSNIYVSKDNLCSGNNPCSPNIQNGIDSASTPSVIKITQETDNENVVLDVDQTIVLQGGWDTSFTSSSSYTTIQGSITITNGTTIIENIILE